MTAFLCWSTSDLHQRDWPVLHRLLAGPLFTQCGQLTKGVHPTPNTPTHRVGFHEIEDGGSLQRLCDLRIAQVSDGGTFTLTDGGERFAAELAPRHCERCGLEKVIGIDGNTCPACPAEGCA